MKNKTILVSLMGALAIAAIVLFLIGKQQPTPPKIVEKPHVRIGMVTFAGYAPFYLAKEKNLFKDIDVDLVRIESIGDLRAAMESKKIDMYLATPDIFASIENKKPVGIGFLAIDESNGADGIVVSKDIQSIEGLRGKKIAVEPGFPPYFILQYMLNQKGMTLRDVQVQNIPSQDAGGAFIAGAVDAMGTYEPALSNAVKQRPESRVLISSKDLPGVIVDIAYASEDLVQNNPEALRKVADGWFEALRYYQRNQDESIRVMSKAFNLQPEEFRAMKADINWLNRDDNIALFNTQETNNIFTTYQKVVETLQKNNPNTYPSKPEEHLKGFLFQQ